VSFQEAIAMKTVLVPVEKNSQIEATLTTACRLAKMFGSYIEGFALSQELNTLVAAEGIGSMVVYPTDLAEQDEEAAAAARKLFEDAMTKNAITPAGAAQDVPRFAWNARALAGDGFLGSRGRVFDVTVVGRPGSTADSPHMSTLEAALFDSGRPILIAPPTAPGHMGQVVTIAWNGSTETARAIAYAKPLIKRAERVIVQVVEGVGVSGPSGADVAQHLKRNGIASETVTVQRGQRSPGAAILEEAIAAGSDLVVKGAYTQSRLRQMIFGGATSHIIAETTLPVLMAH
jgi:nucleotide-binding universal stress UspA family protein